MGLSLAWRSWVVRMVSRCARLVGLGVRLLVSRVQNLRMPALEMLDRCLGLAASMRKVGFAEWQILADAPRIVVSIRIPRL
jgi:hypothetical protein